MCLRLINTSLVYLVMINQLLSTSKTWAQSCGNGDLRLRSGSTNFEGRLEVCYDDQWGTVCHDRIGSGFNGMRASAVACKQLGFSDQGIINTISLYAYMHGEI